MNAADYFAPSIEIIPTRGRPRGKAQKTLDLIKAAIEILRRIHPASVRAVCYQLFILLLLPDMSKNSTAGVSRQLVYAREQEMVPWEWIVDETRSTETIATWAGPQEIFEAAAEQYSLNFWQEQPAWIEVWSEKGTVRGTLAPILKKYAVDFRVMHGYGSATVIHDVAAAASRSEKRLTILYVGDRDPSGMGMSELDIPRRLAEYCAMEGVPAEMVPAVIRVAITKKDTTRKAGVPSFPADDKTKDPRHKWYVQNYGPLCWELDALNPVILRDRVEAAIVARLDMDAWEHALKIEAVQRESADRYAKGFPAFLRKSKK